MSLSSGLLQMELVLTYPKYAHMSVAMGRGDSGNAASGKVSIERACMISDVTGRTQPFVFEVYLARDPVERCLRRAVGHAPDWECDHDPTDTGNHSADGNEARRGALLEQVSHGLEEYDGPYNVDLKGVYSMDQ